MFDLNCLENDLQRYVFEALCVCAVPLTDGPVYVSLVGLLFCYTEVLIYSNVCFMWSFIFVYKLWLFYLVSWLRLSRFLIKAINCGWLLIVRYWASKRVGQFPFQRIWLFSRVCVLPLYTLYLCCLPLFYCCYVVRHSHSLHNHSR